jgi:hypothetical protein
VKRNYFIPYLTIPILPMSELEKEGAISEEEENKEENKDTVDTSNEEPKE